MQSNSTPTPAPNPRRERLLVVELWGLGDLALAMPFLQTASRHTRVTLLAKPHAAPLVHRFCPDIELVPLDAPWTAFQHKYQLARWPWSHLSAALAGLRSRRFVAAVSARPDPRDHALMAVTGAAVRTGFPRAGSAVLLTDRLERPVSRHRSAYWQALAAHHGWAIPVHTPPSRAGNHLVIHPGAAQPVREWPADRFADLAGRLRAAGWRVTVIDPTLRDLDRLLEILASADRFIGNDSGPGHLAALLGVPTFTLFGPQLPELFAPTHPRSAWIEGTPCPHKPCFDACRFATPHCIRELDPDTVWAAVQSFLRNAA